MSILQNENTLKIIINKSTAEVFNFTISPENTPKWFDGIKKETINNKQITIGTIYKNNSGKYKVTAFIPNKLFELANDTYKVRYTYKSIGKNKCEMIYYESGELKTITPQSVLQKLKYIMEIKNE